MEDCEGIIGVVAEELPEGRALARYRRNAACGSCSSAEGCLMSAMEAVDAFVEVRNEIGARVGDRVQIFWDDSSFLLTAFSFYLVPTLCVVFGALTGYFYGGGEGAPENPQAIAGAFAGLAIGLLIAWGLGKALSGKKERTPEIAEILGRGEVGEQQSGIDNPPAKHY
jgi:positive regulator of sigma E activity